MIWFSASHAVAQVVMVLSVCSAIALAALLVLLVIRRDTQEKHRKSKRARLIWLSREILGADEAEAAELVRQSRPDELLEACLQLYQLVRGTDRKQLTEFVERYDLLAKVEKRLSSRLAPRRVDAIRTLERIGSHRAIDLLTHMMIRDRALTVRQEAAAGLARLDALPKPTVVVAVLEMETRPITRLDCALLRSMAVREPEDMLVLSRRILPPGLKAAVVEALGWIPNFGGLPEIKKAASDENVDIRCAALRAACKIGHPAVRNWIEFLLHDADETARAQAAMTAGALKLRKFTPVLEQLSHDFSPWVRMRSKEALKRMRLEVPDA